MLVKVIKDFNDRTADLVTRVVDDELDVTEQRAEELIKGGFVEKVVEKEDDDSALNQTPPESDENLDDSVEEPTEDSAEDTTPEPESKPEPKKGSKAKKNEKKD